MTHATDTQERFKKAGEPDLLRVWNWLASFSVACETVPVAKVRRLCDLVVEHAAYGVPLDLNMRRRVEEILGGPQDQNA